MGELCEYIRSQCDTGEALTLKELAERASVSPFHLQRSFRAAIGITPREYVEACRLEALKGRLRESQTVTSAIYEAGFGSGSRVYERVDSRLGMTPGQYRAGGRNISISWADAKTPLGLIMMAATDRGVCFVQFGESRDDLLAKLRAEYPAANLICTSRPYSAQFDAWIHALSQYLEDFRGRLAIPLDVRGTAFQFKVWDYLQSIPCGEVRSYAEVASGIGRPSAARAVGRACASNRVALVVPCHRVIRGSGVPGGYRWGLDLQRVLLEGERRAQQR